MISWTEDEPPQMIDSSDEEETEENAEGETEDGRKRVLSIVLGRRPRAVTTYVWERRGRMGDSH
eukprot:5854544-Karenia_brevis.AAC.1